MCVCLTAVLASQESTVRAASEEARTTGGDAYACACARSHSVTAPRSCLRVGRRCGAPCSSGAPHTARPRSLAHAGPAASRGSEHALLHCDARMFRPHHATRRRLAMALAQPHWRPVPCTHADRAGSTRVRRKAADGAPHLHHRDLREVRAAVSEWALSRILAAPASCHPVCFPCTHCARFAQVGDRAGSAVASAARAPRPVAHREHREHVSHVRPRAPTHWHCP